MLQRPASYWETSRLLGTYDVLIVGSGMVGLWTAFHLRQRAPRLKVGIVDQLPSGQAGASTRNAGFACFGSPTELLDDLRHESRNAIVERLAWRFEGLQAWRATFGTDALGWQPGQGFEIFSREQEAEWENAQQHLDTLNALADAAGIPEKVYARCTPPIPSLLGCIAIEHEAGLHAGMAHQSLKKAVSDLGMDLLQGVEIPEKSLWERTHSNHWHLPTDRGILRAGHMVVAANAWTGTLLGRTDVLPGRGQVLLTEPIEQLPYRGTYHADEGYLYFRNVENRLLLGGGRNAFRRQEETFDGNTSEEVQNYLDAYLKDVLLPGFDVEVSDRWAGTMAFSVDGSKMPILESQHGLTIVARMGGMGVALAPKAGQKAAEMVLESL